MKKKIFVCVFIIIFALAVSGVIWYFYMVKSREEQVEQLQPENIAELSDDDSIPEGSLGYYIIDGVYVQENLKDLYMKNSDTRGWIRIPGTKVDYPVMQSSLEDPDFYLHRDFNKEYYFGGSIYAAAEADTVFPSSNVILYGHHMTDGSMFRQIMNYKDESYYEKNKVIWYQTLDGLGKYEVIAAYRTSTHDGDFKFWEYINPNKQEFDTYVEESREKTGYTPRESAVYGDKLISLVTCAYHTYNGKFVVVAKRVGYKGIDKTKEPIAVLNTK